MPSRQRNLIISISGGSLGGTSFVIPEGGIKTFGRTRSADVAVEDDNFMSGVHFEIENFGDKAELRDRQSRNKTWVNKEPVTQKPLQHGDEVRAGKTVFSVQWETNTDVPEAPPIVAPPQQIMEPVVVPKPPVGSHPIYAQQSVGPLPSSPFDSSIVTIMPAMPGNGHATGKSPLSQGPPVSNLDRESRVVSPIESLDHSFYDKYAKQIEGGNESGFGSSSDWQSSIAHPVGDARKEESEVGIVSDEPLESDQFRRLMLNRSERRVSFSQLLDALSHVCHFHVIAHFRKLGRRTPSNVNAISLFPDVPDAVDLLPVAISDREWLEECNEQFTQRLVDNDGVVVVLSCTNLVDPETLMELGLAGIEGYSEPNGFVGWYWPSMLKIMSDGMSDHAVSRWMGDSIDGLIFPIPGSDRITGLVRGSLVAPLEGIGFD